MKRVGITFFGGLVLFCCAQVSFAIDRFVSLLGTHQTPFTNWTEAATNIQAAIDAASAGDTVRVTNGIYSTGGKVMVGDLTNRVALDKALTVQSINGPAVTAIQGAWDAATNGSSAVRCAWLTNGATLSGFTIFKGATRPVNTSPSQQMKGGGVWGASTNAIVTNCWITTNAASRYGGGAHQVTLKNCNLISNQASGPGGSGSINDGDGGGADSCVLQNCVLTGNFGKSTGGGANNSILKNCALIQNSAVLFGGGAFGGTLVNCTVVSNSGGGFNVYGAAVASASLTNCIVYGNALVSPSYYSNYYDCTFSFSCSSPLPPGIGNISTDPLFLSDGIHLSETSPCRSVGITNGVLGADIDGQSWFNPPSIGADEWHPAPLLVREPQFDFRGSPTRLTMVKDLVAGHEPFTFFWRKDGVVLEENSHFNSTDSLNLRVNSFGPADAGDYQLIISNGFGMTTSAAVRVAIHCADAAAISPASPFSNWATAAATVQDAIDVAQAGDIVLVTNGIYLSGGKVVTGDLKNRVALTKPLTVVSVNGPAVTTIQGAWDANTNGPLAVRCAWLTNGAVLNGFTLQGGATRTNGDSTLQNGGGVWGASTQVVVANCWIFTNSAALDGGGIFQASVSRCKIIGNRANTGGGVANSFLTSSLLLRNFAKSSGGGGDKSTFQNCTIADNSASSAGGIATSIIWNCILAFNKTPLATPNFGGPCSINFCCVNFSTFPGQSVFGSSNVTSSAQLMDDFHIASTSPCRSSGSSLYALDTDLDGEPWSNPPSMGCDEVVESGIVGPLSVSASVQWSEVAERQKMFLNGTVNGRVTRLAWSYGDGSLLTNVSSFSLSHDWTNAGDYTATFTAYNSDYTNGVSADVMVHVIPLISPTIDSIGLDGTNFTLNFFGQSNVTYRVDRATNLMPPVFWQTLAFPVGASNLIQIIDAKATNAAQFYRLRSP